MINKVKKYFKMLWCAYNDHPNKIEMKRHESAFYKNNDYVEYKCNTCNEIIGVHEIKCHKTKHSISH